MVNKLGNIVLPFLALIGASCVQAGTDNPPLPEAPCPSGKQMADYLKLSVTVIQHGVELTMGGHQYIVGLVLGKDGNIRTGINAPKNLRLLETKNTGQGTSAPHAFCRYQEDSSSNPDGFYLHVVLPQHFKGYWESVRGAGVDQVKFYGDYYKAQEVLRKALGPEEVKDATPSFKMPETYEEALRILGLKDGATLDDAKTAYKKLALKYNPDRAVDDKEKATENFKAVRESLDLFTMKLEERRKK